MTTPYHYLIAAPDSAAAALIVELCAWHDRMVAHVRRHGAARGACACLDQDECPRAQAADLWKQASGTFGDAAEALTFLRAHARGADA